VGWVEGANGMTAISIQQAQGKLTDLIHNLTPW
jgi:hypothetical protein